MKNLLNVQVTHDKHQTAVNVDISAAGVTALVGVTLLGTAFIQRWRHRP